MGASIPMKGYGMVGLLKKASEFVETKHVTNKRWCFYVGTSMTLEG